MSEEAIKQRRKYQKEYRDAHKEEINKRQNEWRKKNKDKVREYNKNYWQRLVEKQNA